MLVGFVNLLLLRPMVSNVSEAMRGRGGLCFLSFTSLENVDFTVSLPLTTDMIELIELQVEKCEVILYYIFEESLVRYLK